MTRSATDLRGSAQVVAGPPRGRTLGTALDRAEAARAAQVATRLYSALRSLVAGLPDHARGASAMARHLNVARNSCQRVVVALAEPQPTPSTLAQVPGVQGLRLLVEGFRQRGADAADLAAAERAIDQFRQFIDETGGSQSKLARRLAVGATTARAQLAPAATRAAVTARRHLFAAASEVTGRHSDLQVTIYAYRLQPGDPTQLERAMLTGEFGSMSEPWAMPRGVVLGNVKFEDAPGGRPAYESLDHTPAHGQTQRALLEEFCSKPLPVVTSRGSERKLVQAIDAPNAERGRPVDFVVANRSVHPATFPETDEPSLEGVWKLVNYPTRHMVFDVFLHRDMERHFRPGIDVQLWGPNLDVKPADRWLTRFPDVPRLQLLGTGVDHAQTDAYPRYVALAKTFFQRVGWEPEEFVGYRCEVAHPIWRAGYFMTFEHLG